MWIKGQIELDRFSGIRRSLIPLRDYVRYARAELAVALFHQPHQKPHALPGKLVLTLTSYPAR